MAEAYKVLGQQALAATTATTVYTCPSSTETIVSVVVVCNRGTTPTTFRLGVDVGGAGDGDSDYLFYDTPIEANESLEVARGITLDAADLIRCYAGNANLTFAVFGVEKT